MAAKLTYAEWTDEELAILKEQYGRITVKEISVLLSRHTFIGVVLRARHLGLYSKLHCTHTPEAKERIRNARLEYYKTHDNYFKGKHLLESTKTLISEAAKKQMSPLGMREILSERAKKQFGTPDMRKKQSERMKAQFQNPEWLKDYFKCVRRRPTSIEKRICEIIERSHVPFKYNGNFELGVTLNGMIPDFVNVNGKKQVIEVFGNYWHDPEKKKVHWNRTELGRIMAYNSLGWSCLIIKQDDIKRKTDVELEKVISSFEAKGGK